MGALRAEVSRPGDERFHAAFCRRLRAYAGLTAQQTRSVQGWSPGRHSLRMTIESTIGETILDGLDSRAHETVSAWSLTETFVLSPNRGRGGAVPSPLPFIPIQSYKLGGRRFGANRQKGRKHAGCALIAPLGTPILAMADGTIAEWTGREFYHGTYSIAVQHQGYVARYCEIKGVAPGIGWGTIVKAGDVIAFVGKMHVDSMLHLEIYGQPYGTGGLTNRKNQPFQRRADLQNPTTLLDRLSHDIPVLEL